MCLLRRTVFTMCSNLFHFCQKASRTVKDLHPTSNTVIYAYFEWPTVYVCGKRNYDFVPQDRTNLHTFLKTHMYVSTYLRTNARWKRDIGVENITRQAATQSVLRYYACCTVSSCSSPIRLRNRQRVVWGGWPHLSKSARLRDKKVEDINFPGSMETTLKVSKEKSTLSDWDGCHCPAFFEYDPCLEFRQKTHFLTPRRF